MSETDDPDEELESIRERKREELLEGETDGGESGAPPEPIHVEGVDHLQSLLAEHDRVLADFYADWCGPCKMLAPTVEEIAAEEDVAVVKIDIDANQQLAGQYGVRGVPTVYLFVDGEPAQEWVGVQDKGTYVNAIRAA